MKCLINSLKQFYGRYPDLIRKYWRSVKDVMPDSFHPVISLVLSCCFISSTQVIKLKCCHFYQLMLAVLVGQTPLSQSKASGCVNGWFDFSSQHTFADNCYRFCHTVLIYWICCFLYYFISYGCLVWRPIFVQLSEVLSCVSCVKLNTRSFCYYQNQNPLYLTRASSHRLDSV